MATRKEGSFSWESGFEGGYAAKTGVPNEASERCLHVRRTTPSPANVRYADQHTQGTLLAVAREAAGLKVCVPEMEMLR